jgi:hypothetical protein
MNDMSPIGEAVMARAGSVFRLLEPCVVAAFLGFLAACGGGGGGGGEPVVVRPAAYFIDGVEYAFDYQLDAQGRVDSFRISRRADIAYPTPPDSDFNPIKCTGSLHGRYDCASEAGIYFRTMQGDAHVAMSLDYGNPAERTSRSYAYDPVGLNSVDWKRAYGPSIHRYDVGSEKLSYDAGGRLASVNETYSSCNYFCLGATADIPIVVDSTGRLLRAERAPVAVPPYAGPPGMTRSVTTWTYDSRGYMERMDVTEYDGFDVARTSSTRYTADGDGWLTSRIVHSEDRDGVVTETVDRYSFVRSGGYVEEESFTQAEPQGFYRQRAPQRVRYEANRLPTGPLFVPRALTGLKGADYFGIISSHDR